MLNLENLQTQLIGKTIKEVIKHPFKDSGLLIKFIDNTILEYGYSDGFGTTLFNDVKIKEL